MRTECEFCGKTFRSEGESYCKACVKAGDVMECARCGELAPADALREGPDTSDYGCELLCESCEEVALEEMNEEEDEEEDEEAAP